MGNVKSWWFSIILLLTMSRVRWFFFVCVCVLGGGGEREEVMVVISMLGLPLARHLHGPIVHVQGYSHVWFVLFGGVCRCVLTFMRKMSCVLEWERRSLNICQTPLLFSTFNITLSVTNSSCLAQY